jgi:hypothetical protein
MIRSIRPKARGDTMRRTSLARTTMVATGLAVIGALAACGDDDTGTGGSDGTAPADATPTTSAAAAEPLIDPGDGGRYEPAIDAADFVAGVDNPYMPLAPGARWVYEGEADGETERVEVTVTDERKEVMGVAAVVVRDTVTAGGELVEDTRDWFAQDRAGNVWYLGEETAEYEEGEVTSTEGSWQAGVDGALPGIVMPADPAVGDAYRQEYLEGEAEDLAEVLRLDATATVPTGEYRDLLVTEEWNPLDPEPVEEKYYARGIGLVLEVTTRGGDERVELVEHQP